MSKCADLSIEFRSINKDVLETLHPLLVQFFNCDNDNYRELYKILIGDKDPKTGKRITDARLNELMSGVCRSMDVDDDIDERGEYFHLGIGDSGYTDNKFWILVADKYKLDLEITGVSCEREWDADETVYIGGNLNYLCVQLTDDEIVELEKASYNDPKIADEIWYDDHLNIAEDNYISITGWLRGKLAKQRTYDTFYTKYTPPIVLIDCENNYLDNLKSFVDNNKHLPDMDEYLVKSGLFKTTIGVEKRRRIEVDINGVKLYADSKHGVTQRKKNVEKLKKLLS